MENNTAEKITDNNNAPHIDAEAKEKKAEKKAKKKKKRILIL